MATVIGSGKIRVDSGDTLSGIAQQYLGSSGKWKELGGYSGDPRKMPAGTILTLPGGGGQSGSAQSGGDMNTLVDAMMGKGYNNRAEAEAVAKGDFDRYWKEYVDNRYALSGYYWKILARWEQGSRGNCSVASRRG